MLGKSGVGGYMLIAMNTYSSGLGVTFRQGEC